MVHLIGLLHPGAMGAALATVLVGAGHEVAWCSAGRSAATSARAHAAGATDLPSLAQLLDACPVVISVCPPEGAAALASEVAGYDGVYVDANAVSPATSIGIGTLINAGGGRYVDASVIGPPPTRPGQTRLYLSGTAAPQVADLFSDTVVSARVVGTDSSRASALKMAYAAWTKGSSALLLAVRALAGELDVADLLYAEWDESVPGLRARSDLAAKAAAEKAWRWTFEMTEIGATLDAANLPGDFGRAAAAVYAGIAAAAETDAAARADTNSEFAPPPR